ncbi:hypothetical protein PIB30_063079 [Stylosanthes scabra]|uniref:Cytochrome b5 heme-binding domain-containing protein n=1 Tax=Stylosanthes scabra TaxID=79078 RepID=A0ABU6UK50_9FABA|nr:hypothetical protein [Stylosanthes scabra]
MSSKVFTFEDVANHNHKNDCWLIINGKVYDVTPFLDDHPGGDEVLLTATGRDATIDFEDVGHSDSAVEMMQKYFVGDVDTNTLPAESKHNLPPPTLAPSTSNQSSAGFIIQFFQYVLPLLILGFAFALQFFGKKDKPEEN